MKPVSRTFLFTVIMSLLMVCHALAQEKQPQGADLLRAKIEQFEKMDISSKSSSVQIIYKRTLLRLYNQLAASLQKDIKDLKAMQSAVGGANTDSQKEIAAELQTLAQEQSETAEKSQTLNDDLKGSASTETSQAPVPPATSDLPLSDAVYRPRTTARPETSADGSASVSSMPASDSITNRPQAGAGDQADIDPPDLTKINQPIVGETKLVGNEGAATKGATVIALITAADGSTVSKTATASNDGSFIIYYPKGLVAGSDIMFKQTVNGTDSKASHAIGVTTQAAIDKARDPHGPVELMVGGSVISNQSQDFSQVDPFFGFIAGYIGHKVLSKHKSDFGAFNLRVEGLFSASARKAEAPAKSTTTSATTGGGTTGGGTTGGGTTGGGTTGGGTTATNTPDLPFLSSRKTFETGVQLWWAFPVPGSGGLFALGPYAAYGTSTVLDKNELKDEPVKVGATNNNIGGNDVDLDTSQVKANNDLKRYFEVGFMADVLLPNNQVFIHATFAKGNFEAYDGLYDNYNTKNRFHGRVDIFPAGLFRKFGEQKKVAPIFGVDLNASRGPDSLRFFSGFAVNLKAPKTGEEPPFGGEDDSGTAKPAAATKSTNK
jgi:hypothetical protein